MLFRSIYINRYFKLTISNTKRNFIRNTFRFKQHGICLLYTSYSFNKNTVANIVVKGKNKKIDPREYKRLNQIYSEIFLGAKPFQSDAQQTAPSSKNLIYTVEKAVSNGKQSQVVLKSANGEQLRGYVVGIPCPKTNQRIIDLKTVKRKDEKLGEYIIIQGYKAA